MEKGTDAAMAALLDRLVAQRAAIATDLLQALRRDLGAAHGGEKPLERARGR